MPALAGPFVAFALGAALAWLVRDEAPRDDDDAFRTRAKIVALFAALVIAPAFAYFLAFAGDWSLFYLVDSRRVPSAIGLVLVVADAALAVLGFVLGHLAARRRLFSRALPALTLAPLSIALAMIAAFLPKLRVDGTFDQVTSRFGTQPVSGGPLGWAILWMGTMLATGFVITARALSERPRTARPRSPEAPKVKQPILGRRR